MADTLMPSFLRSAPRRTRVLSLLAAGLVLVTAGYAQFGGFNAGPRRGGGSYGRSGEIYVPESVKITREIDSRSVEVPIWTNPVGFERDVFTFTRLRFDKNGTGRSRGGWTTDLPDADLNLSFRLQQMTSIKTDPNGRTLRATDPELASYPFLFAAAPNAIGLSPDEVVALRKYLLNGGCMIMTDFWGDQELATM